MTALTVNTAQLRNFATVVTDIGNTTGYGTGLPSCISAKQVAEDHIYLSPHETGMFYMSVSFKTDGLRESILGVLKAFTDAMASTSTELNRTADEYDTDDDEAAAQLDAAYLDCFTGTTTGINRWSQAVYMEVAKSVMTMQGPSVPEEQSEVVDYVAEILTTDWTSPTEVTNQVIKLCSGGWDPVEEVTKIFSGDWNSLYKTADALENIGDYFQGLGTYIPTAASKGINSWTGNVADECLRYFSRLGGECAEWKTNVTDPVDALRFVAGGMRTWADSISALLTSIIDAILVAIISAIGGTALIETVVGAIIGYLGAIGALAVSAYKFNQAWQELQDVMAAINALVATLLTFSQLAVPGSIEFSMPHAYDNTLVD